MEPTQQKGLGQHPQSQSKLAVQRAWVSLGGDTHLVVTHLFACTGLWLPSPAPQTEQNPTKPTPYGQAELGN